MTLDDETAHNLTAAMPLIRSASTPPEPVVEALRKCLNYIENTESELGITLDCGDAARAALAAAPVPARPSET